jgi:UDP-N-acetylmuramoyl-tripeptide--D-alanyl-D-alanine ligase
MLTVSVDRILAVTGGELLAGSPDKIANGLCLDSRDVGPGCLFVALPGERTDGHDFLASAVSGGARVLLVTRGAEELVDVSELAEAREVAIVRVADALKAVQDFATYHRSRLHCEVLGVTGSSGKTTTKDFVDAVLSTQLRVVSTQGNRNNELGVPLTILRAGAETDVLVVEMGMRGIGQIARLCEIAAPTLGLLTNIGTSHIELLGSQEAVADAKGELVRALPASGAAFLNGDDMYSDTIAGTSVAPVTLFGLSARCAVRAENVELDAESRASFDLVSPDATARVTLPLPGRHNVYNALAAAAVGLRVGIAAENIALGLSSATLSGMRMQVIDSSSGVTVINDAYNANPVSMRAAIDTLASMQPSGRRVAVLGDMAELGSLTELAHFQMGEAVARSPIDVLFTVGPRARRIAEGALAEGMPAESVQSFADAEMAGPAVASRVERGDVVLVKASRVMALETVVEGIVSPQ